MNPLLYIALFAHIVSFIVGFGAVIVIDTFGSLWLMKRVKLSGVTYVANVTQRLIWIGWAGLVISGSVLLWYKLAVFGGRMDSLTWIKLFAVALLGLNGLYLHITKKGIESVGDDDAVSSLVKFRIALASTISQAGWWTALIIGFLHRQVAHYIPWPESATPWIIGVLLAVATAAAAGEYLLRRPRIA